MNKNISTTAQLFNEISGFLKGSHKVHITPRTFSVRCGKCCILYVYRKKDEVWTCKKKDLSTSCLQITDNIYRDLVNILYHGKVMRFGNFESLEGISMDPLKNLDISNRFNIIDVFEWYSGTSYELLLTFLFRLSRRSQSEIVANTQKSFLSKNEKINQIKVFLQDFQRKNSEDRDDIGNNAESKTGIDSVNLENLGESCQDIREFSNEILRDLCIFFLKNNRKKCLNDKDDHLKGPSVFLQLAILKAMVDLEQDLNDNFSLIFNFLKKYNDIDVELENQKQPQIKCTSSTAQANESIIENSVNNYNLDTTLNKHLNVNSNFNMLLLNFKNPLANSKPEDFVDNIRGNDYKGENLDKNQKKDNFAINEMILNIALKIESSLHYYRILQLISSGYLNFKPISSMSAYLRKHTYSDIFYALKNLQLTLNQNTAYEDKPLVCHINIKTPSKAIETQISSKIADIEIPEPDRNSYFLWSLEDCPTSQYAAEFRKHNDYKIIHDKHFLFIEFVGLKHLVRDVLEVSIIERTHGYTILGLVFDHSDFPLIYCALVIDVNTSPGDYGKSNKKIYKNRSKRIKSILENLNSNKEVRKTSELKNTEYQKPIAQKTGVSIDNDYEWHSGTSNRDTAVGNNPSNLTSKQATAEILSGSILSSGKNKKIATRISKKQTDSQSVSDSKENDFSNSETESSIEQARKSDFSSDRSSTDQDIIENIDSNSMKAIQKRNSDLNPTDFVTVVISEDQGRVSKLDSKNIQENSRKKSFHTLKDESRSLETAPKNSSNIKSILNRTLPNGTVSTQEINTQSAQNRIGTCYKTKDESIMQKRLSDLRFLNKESNQEILSSILNVHGISDRNLDVNFLVNLPHLVNPYIQKFSTNLPIEDSKFYSEISGDLDFTEKVVDLSFICQEKRLESLDKSHIHTERVNKCFNTMDSGEKTFKTSESFLKKTNLTKYSEVEIPQITPSNILKILPIKNPSIFSEITTVLPYTTFRFSSLSNCKSNISNYNGLKDSLEIFLRLFDTTYFRILVDFDKNVISILEKLREELDFVFYCKSRSFIKEYSKFYGFQDVCTLFKILNRIETPPEVDGNLKKDVNIVFDPHSSRLKDQNTKLERPNKESKRKRTLIENQDRKVFGENTRHIDEPEKLKKNLDDLEDSILKYATIVVPNKDNQQNKISEEKIIEDTKSNQDLNSRSKENKQNRRQFRDVKCLKKKFCDKALSRKSAQNNPIDSLHSSIDKYSNTYSFDILDSSVFKKSLSIDLEAPDSSNLFSIKLKIPKTDIAHFSNSFKDHPARIDFKEELAVQKSIKNDSHLDNSKIHIPEAPLKNLLENTSSVLSTQNNSCQYADILKDPKDKDINENRKSMLDDLVATQSTKGYKNKQHITYNIYKIASKKRSDQILRNIKNIYTGDITTLITNDCLYGLRHSRTDKDFIHLLKTSSDIVECFDQILSLIQNYFELQILINKLNLDDAKTYEILGKLKKTLLNEVEKGCSEISNVGGHTKDNFNLNHAGEVVNDNQKLLEDYFMFLHQNYDTNFSFETHKPKSADHIIENSRFLRKFSPFYREFIQNFTRNNSLGRLRETIQNSDKNLCQNENINRCNYDKIAFDHILQKNNEKTTEDNLSLFIQKNNNFNFEYELTRKCFPIKIQETIDKNIAISLNYTLKGIFNYQKSEVKEMNLNNSTNLPREPINNHFYLDSKFDSNPAHHAYTSNTRHVLKNHTHLDCNDTDHMVTKESEYKKNTQLTENSTNIIDSDSGGRLKTIIKFNQTSEQLKGLSNQRFRQNSVCSGIYDEKSTLLSRDCRSNSLLKQIDVGLNSPEKHKNVRGCTLNELNTVNRNNNSKPYQTREYINSAGTKNSVQNLQRNFGCDLFLKNHANDGSKRIYRSFGPEPPETKHSQNFVEYPEDSQTSIQQRYHKISKTLKNLQESSIRVHGVAMDPFENFQNKLPLLKALKLPNTDTNSYVVVHKETSKEYIVNLKDYTCTCGRFQAFMIPCPHAVLVLENPYQLVSVVYNLGAFSFKYGIKNIISDQEFSKSLYGLILERIDMILGLYDVKIEENKAILEKVEAEKPKEILIKPKKLFLSENNKKFAHIRPVIHAIKKNSSNFQNDSTINAENLLSINLQNEKTKEIPSRNRKLNPRKRPPKGVGLVTTSTTTQNKSPLNRNFQDRLRKDRRDENTNKKNERISSAIPKNNQIISNLQLHSNIAFPRIFKTNPTFLETRSFKQNQDNFIKYNPLGEYPKRDEVLSDRLSDRKDVFIHDLSQKNQSIISNVSHDQYKFPQNQTFLNKESNKRVYNRRIQNVSFPHSNYYTPQQKLLSSGTNNLNRSRLFRSPNQYIKNMGISTNLRNHNISHFEQNNPYLINPPNFTNNSEYNTQTNLSQYSIEKNMIPNSYLLDQNSDSKAIVNPFNQKLLRQNFDVNKDQRFDSEIPHSAENTSYHNSNNQDVLATRKNSKYSVLHSNNTVFFPHNNITEHAHQKSNSLISYDSQQIPNPFPITSKNKSHHISRFRNTDNETPMRYMTLNSLHQHLPTFQEKIQNITKTRDLAKIHGQSFNNSAVFQNSRRRSSKIISDRQADVNTNIPLLFNNSGFVPKKHEINHLQSTINVDLLSTVYERHSKENTDKNIKFGSNVDPDEKKKYPKHNENEKKSH